MAKHIFLFAAVALVVLVQQNDAATIKVEDVQGVLSMADKHITKVTHALNSSVNFDEVLHNFDSKYILINAFNNAINSRFYLTHTAVENKIRESNGVQLHLCEKEINIYEESIKNMKKLKHDCAYFFLQAAQSNVDKIENIRKNLDNKLAALKEEKEKCKSFKDSTDVLFCGTKIVNEAIDLAKEIEPLNTQIQRLDDQLDSMFAKIDLCHSTNAISAVGKKFYANAASVQKCLKS